jgi:1-acyl-sn-glycerol-3-phosphate acyltransferase
MTIIRSTIFMIWFILISVVLHIVLLPALILPRQAAAFAGRTWSIAALWGLKVFADLRYEVRGSAPPEGILVASKHMTMWDSLALYVLLGTPYPVIKRELLNIPFYGWYARKAGVIAIDRGAHASALRKMAAEAKAAVAAGHTVMIFPEGHRQPPGARPDYKPGVAALYGLLDVPCVPVALNSGLFWMGFIKRPGNVVIEFLPSIPTGLKRQEFMTLLQDRIETATTALVAEGRALLAH